jgi:glycosyltransferase involved in cell wall biosynthesis
MSATQPRPAKILEVSSYPPPRAGWGIRVEFLKKRLEAEGHQCVVLNIGTSRNIPSDEYEMVLGGLDFAKKVWRYSRRGFVVHAHANGDALKGTLLALGALLINLAWGKRGYLTFHAGAIQRFFPQERSRRHVPLYTLLFHLPARIICNNDPVKARIVGYGIRPSKVVPIPGFSREYMEFTPATLPDDVEAFLRRHPSVVFTYVRMRPLFYPVTLIEGMAQVMNRRPDAALLVCGMAGHADPGVREAVEAAIERNGIGSRICLVDDLDHDAFLTVLQRSALYLRTPITDGIASSVLESLALRVPVVACENGTRPPGVITYVAEDAGDLASTVESVLDDRDAIVASLATVDIADTIRPEVELLTS